MPRTAWGIALGATVATILSIVGPVTVAAGLLVLGVAGMGRGRRAFVATSTIMAAIYALILGAFTPGPEPLLQTTWLDWGLEGAITGAIGMMRLSAVLAVNLAVVTNITLPAWLDALHLPARATAFTASVLLAAKDLADDQDRIVAARKTDGAWPVGRRARARAAAGVVAPMVVGSVRRAETRREALRLAGLDTGPRFAPIVAVTALAIAGRLAFVAVPNVSLAFALVFAGGVVFGARVGAWAGAWSMLLTDLMFSGLAPTALVNVPAMALVGAVGGIFSRLELTADRVSVAAWAGVAGVVSTLLFSVAADSAEVLIIPEFRSTPGFWRLRVFAGLVFNAVPAILNGVLFAAVVGPVARAMAAYRSRPA